MKSVLICLPFCANDAILAEALCDLIFLFNGRQQKGHVLLVAATDTHLELREKVKIAAEVAFVTAEMVIATAPPTTNDKNARINSMFLFAATYISKNYRSAFLWLEPDCCPLKPDWMDKISEAYFSQPKRYCGSFMQVSGAGMFLARVGCYPPDCFTDLVSFLGGAGPFDLLSGSVIIPKASKTSLVQELKFTDEGCIGKLKDNAVLLHHDKNGIMLERLRHQIETAK